MLATAENNKGRIRQTLDGSFEGFQGANSHNQSYGSYSNPQNMPACDSQNSMMSQNNSLTMDNRKQNNLGVLTSQQVGNAQFYAANITTNASNIIV